MFLINLTEIQMSHVFEHVLIIFCFNVTSMLQVSRLVVEMMKREWPQHWPGLLEELHQLSKRGPTQTELVLFVFLRIAEDVATLQARISIQYHDSLNIMDRRDRLREK